MGLQEDVIRKVARFLIDNAGASIENRIRLVTTLAEEILSDITEAGGDRDRLCVWKMRHPELMKKSDASLYTISDVLADFIMDIDQVAERAAEYPVSNAERSYREEAKRNKKEKSLILDEDESDAESGWPKAFKPGCVSESALTLDNPVERTLFGERRDMSAEELASELSAIQRKPAKFIRRYADGNAWNRQDSIRRRTAENVAEAIERLELRRVRSCTVCGNGFYVHSRRVGGQKICDVMPHPRKKTVTFCQYEQDKALSRRRSQRKRARQKLSS